MAPMCFGYHDTAAPEDIPEITQEIREFYFGSNNITAENLGDLTKVRCSVTDILTTSNDVQ